MTWIFRAQLTSSSSRQGVQTQTKLSLKHHISIHCPNAVVSSRRQLQ